MDVDQREYDQPNPSRAVRFRFSLVANWTLEKSQNRLLPPFLVRLERVPGGCWGGENDSTCDSRCSFASPAARLSHHRERREIRLAGTNERFKCHSETLSKYCNTLDDRCSGSAGFL